MKSSQKQARGGSRDSALESTLAALRTVGAIPRLARGLATERAAVKAGLQRGILAEVAAFSATRNPEVIPTLATHLEDLMSEVERLCAGAAGAGFQFVRVHAQLRAAQRFPLEAVLHAYRCAHRALARWLRDAALATRECDSRALISAVDDFAIEYTNVTSTIAAAEYVAHARLLAEADTDRRTELLNILLNGYDEADGRVSALLRRAGYLEQRQSYCVVLAQPVDPLEMDNIARAQRIIRSISEVLAPLPVRLLAGVRNNAITGVISETRRLSGWTAEKHDIAGRLRQRLLLLGPAVLIGLSRGYPSTSFIPRGLQEASIALDHASVTDRVSQYAALPLRRLLLHRSGGAAPLALPDWARALETADPKSKALWTATVRALADADMNVQRAARSLAVHPNTIYARIERIRGLTGMHCQRYHELTDLLLAIEANTPRSVAH